VRNNAIYVITLTRARPVGDIEAYIQVNGGWKGKKRWQ
jgi:hypothetical protein